MNLLDFQQRIQKLFGQDQLTAIEGEAGFTYRGIDEIRRVGYATNLTPAVIEQAKEGECDLILTHHDAWSFVFGLKERCLEMLEEWQISHYFVHLPLDDADFGTNVTLMEKLGVQGLERSHLEKGFHCGRIGEFPEEVEFSEVVARLEALLAEPVQAWKNHSRRVKRVGIVTGGGGMTPDVKEAVDKQCDLYITGEKVLYTLQYAQHAKIDLIIGSHTFTELFGIESLAKKVQESAPDVEIVRLQEEHLETRRHI